MYEGNKTVQYAFYAGVLVLFIFGLCCFSGSYFDGQRSTDVRTRIDDCKNLNTELQRTNQTIKSEIEESIERLGSAEAELNRAASSIERCEQILRIAEQRTKERNP